MILSALLLLKNRIRYNAHAVCLICANLKIPHFGQDSSHLCKFRNSSFGLAFAPDSITSSKGQAGMNATTDGISKPDSGKMQESQSLRIAPDL